MKKVGVLTLTSNDNFGNKLQNYAVIYFLKKMGCQGETIWITNPFKDTKIKQLLRRIKRIIYDNIVKRKRTKYFLDFNKILNIKNMIIFDDDICKFENKYNYFLVGSDQVWNYNFFNNEKLFFLSQFPKEKKISFSASFGVDNIPKELKSKYKKGLSGFKYLSVREDKGKDIIRKLTGIDDVSVLVDPTMLLTKEEWDLVSKKPRQINLLNGKKYVLNYFLGELSESRKEAIEVVAKENDCTIINILDKSDPFYNCGPSEFLYLEKNAFLICTDSFHSSVFAILYDRPFVIFDREQDGVENMSSRLDTLISKFKLKNRRYYGKNITKENLEHDYTEAYKILENERKKSKEFLEKALDLK